MRWLLGVVIVLSLAAASLRSAPARAELRPDEVAVIAMARSAQSQRLAKYYVEARGIPPYQIFYLKGKPGATMSRSVWEEEARPAIRAWLGEDGRQEKIRCLVTCWDVPLRIAARSQNAPVVVAREEYLTRSRAALIARFCEVLKGIDSLVPGSPAPERAALTGDAALGSLTAQFDAALKAAQERINGLKSAEEKKQNGAALERAFVAGGGIGGLLQLVTKGGAADRLGADAALQLERLKGQLLGLADGVQALGVLPDSVARDVQNLKLILKTAGLVGAIRWIDEQRELLRRNETQASFDSELSLLWWPDYSLFRWQPNLLHYRYRDLPTGDLKTLMVSRLEAPTFELAEKLIDTAIATEKTGLSGKVYLDARGMQSDPKNAQPGSYSAYDQALRDLAERLRKHTKLEVVINDKAELFQPGDCPEAALYCGWYSLAKYVDAFDWRPGAVGYHLASSEATTLRTPGSKVWCNAMLEDGICATMGPVFEPYLAAFPLPDDFFPLLLTGRYTLAEAYYRSQPFNSWAMVLVGDPLYNPFKNKPALDEDALPERMKKIEAEAPQG